jgi:hypothetical protein
MDLPQLRREQQGQVQPGEVVKWHAEDRSAHAELLYYLALRLQCSAFRVSLLLGHIDGAAPCRADRLAEFHQQVVEDVCMADDLMEVFGERPLEATEKETARS